PGKVLTTTLPSFLAAAVTCGQSEGTAAWAAGTFAPSAAAAPPYNADCIRRRRVILAESGAAPLSSVAIVSPRPLWRRRRAPAHLLLEIPHRDAVERHGAGREIVGIPVLERRLPAAVVTGDDEAAPLDHLGVRRGELLRRVVPLVDHHGLVLPREVVLDDPPVDEVIRELVPQPSEPALGPRAVVVPDAREVLLDGHAHAGVEIPPELGAEHAGQVMPAAPAGGARRRDVAAGPVGEGAPRP